MGRYHVGVDIGGTFTDIVAVDADDGALVTLKTPSTPPTFINGILKGLRDLSFSLGDIDLFVHGSTIATNGIIERKGANTALITTRGFRDVLLCARSTRPDVYDLHWRPGQPLVKRRNIFEVSERVNAKGAVLVPLAEEELLRIEAPLRKRDVRAIAICFLNSFMNPSHELRAKEVLKRIFPDLHISTSYEVFPEIREFERTSTVVANAYIAPLVDHYLEELTAAMRAEGFTSDLLVVHSGGAVMTEAAARRIPARMCYSGPAGGVMGGAYVGKLAGYENVITMDIGGTSTDVALVKEGRPVVRTGLSIEHNIPVSFPSIDVVTVGAGGGSVGWIDAGGILRNGPQSAGANPGPACYDRGGEEPTNTDAQLVLGRLSARGLLDGSVPLDAERARRAIEGRVARHFEWSVEEAASAILTVANANIVNAIRLVSIQRGHDPRDFTLVAFGGAGPMHAVDVARELGIPRVVVPQTPGLASAFGMLQVEVRHDLIRPLFRRESELSASDLNRVFEELEAEAGRLMAEEGIPVGQIRMERLFDLKYFPQSSYLSLEGPEGALTDETVSQLIAEFNTRHREEFGYSVPRHVAEVEVGHVRLVVTGLMSKPELRLLAAGRLTEVEPAGMRRVYFREHGWQDTATYLRDDLAVGVQVAGPAIVEQFDTTTVLPQAATAVVDAYGNLVIAV